MPTYSCFSWLGDRRSALARKIPNDFDGEQDEWQTHLHHGNRIRRKVREDRKVFADDEVYRDLPRFSRRTRRPVIAYD